jgi:hypothetical protein
MKERRSRTGIETSYRDVEQRKTTTLAAGGFGLAAGS